MRRPAETIQFSVAAVIGAILIIYGVVKDGLQLTDLTDPEVQGAITLLTGVVAAVVTWYIARKQRDPASDVTSGSDGTVQ